MKLTIIMDDLHQFFPNQSFIRFSLFLLIVYFSSCSSSPTAFETTLQQQGTHFDIWIQNGEIFDGRDSLALSGDILIKGEEIVYIGQVDARQITIDKVIDAAGKIVSPGFIDTHAHGNPLITPDFVNFLAMGVTTICLGQDGSSPMRKDLGAWMQEVSDTVSGPNIAMFIGHGTLRHLSDVEYDPMPTPEGLQKMKSLLENALQAGCFGMTTGLEYNPGIHAGDNELTTMAKVVGEHNGLIMSHIRNEDNDAVEASIRELLRQGEYCNVHVSHLKIVYGKGAERAKEILDLLDEKEGDNYSVTADLYPYNASYTGIGIVFPQWAKAPNDYNQVKATRREDLLRFLRQKVSSRNGPEATLLGTAPYAGKTLAEVSDEKARPFEEVLADEIGPEGASGAYFVMNDALQTRLLTDPKVMVCSDGSPTMRHPRGYGSFAKIIETYVLQRKLFSLSTAIRKMTSLPAQTLGLDDRGTLEAGKKADILVFDPNQVKANADYTQPHQLASGFDQVIVNGVLRIDNGKFVGERSGKMLKKQAQPNDTGVITKRQPEAIGFDGREFFPPPETVVSQQRKDSNLRIATRRYNTNPTSLENIIWLGRRTAYLSRYRESIEIYTKGLELFPESPELYRHRGHRYISIRQLDQAISDFEKAAQLVKGREVEIEPDGIPNKLNIPLSSLQFNIWYHWALAYYLKADFEKAAELYEQCMSYSTNPDLLTATSDWLYMTYRRGNQKEKAEQILALIATDLEVIENASYLNRLLLYKGLKKPEELLDLNNEDPDRQLEIVTQGYGVGNWYLMEGEVGKAKSIFEKMMKTQYWSAFGYIAAEADLARM